MVLSMLDELKIPLSVQYFFIKKPHKATRPFPFRAKKTQSGQFWRGEGESQVCEVTT